MKQELKDLLKPPFVHRVAPKQHYISVGFARYEDDPETLTIEFNFDLKNFEIEDEFFEFVTKALNNQWERNFAEPLRWIIKYGTPDCIIGH